MFQALARSEEDLCFAIRKLKSNSPRAFVADRRVPLAVHTGCFTRIDQDRPVSLLVVREVYMRVPSLTVDMLVAVIALAERKNLEPASKNLGYHPLLFTKGSRPQIRVSEPVSSSDPMMASS